MSKHITGHTGLLCLLGSPVAHSVSPEMHNEACDQLGLDYSYLAFDVPEDKMPQAVEGLRTMGARGWNITMPGKNIMCKLADKVSPASEISGACNTIVNDNGVLTAYTTDGVGFMRAVAENGVDIIGKKMTLLGAGGAATAILVQAALDGVAEINVFNVRDNFFGRAEEIVAKLNERTSCKVTLHDFSDPEVLRASIADSAILVNGTSVGMAPKTENTIITDTGPACGADRLFDGRNTCCLRPGICGRLGNKFPSAATVLLAIVGFTDTVALNRPDITKRHVVLLQSILS